jgi:hypothetical protein
MTFAIGTAPLGGTKNQRMLVLIHAQLASQQVPRVASVSKQPHLSIYIRLLMASSAGQPHFRTRSEDPIVGNVGFSHTGGPSSSRIMPRPFV